MPADDDVIGVGELAGSEVNLVEQPETVNEPPGSVLGRYAGEDPSVMGSAMDAATKGHPASSATPDGSC